ncbi:MAG: hypothetical protein MUD10_05655, partial [Candidatus Pacebacteria bacterium]|nr:hypothetical protein [Candidatus Paceibacterota bacterium]
GGKGRGMVVNKYFCLFGVEVKARIQNDFMANKYAITEKDEREIRARDKRCVYCVKEFDLQHRNKNKKDWDTIERLNHR